MAYRAETDRAPRVYNRTINANMKGKNTMQFQVITSTVDGNQTKEFSNWEDAYEYAKEWMNGFTHWNHRHFNSADVNLWKTRNGESVRIEDMRSDEEISEALWNDSNPENCDECANQESIAAPSETTKCREHQEKSDDEHYAEMREFFTDNLLELDFKPHMPFCSQCGSEKAHYIGLMRYKQDRPPLTFGFCIPCRDDLVRRADAAKRSAERFGV